MTYSLTITFAAADLQAVVNALAQLTGVTLSPAIPVTPPAPPIDPNANV